MSSYLFVPFEWPRWAQMWTMSLAILFTVFTIVYAWAALQPSVAGRVSVGLRPLSLFF